MLRNKHFLMEEANGEGASGGGALGDGAGASGAGPGASGQAGAAGSADGASGNAGGAGQGDGGGANNDGGQAAPKVQIPENWQEILPDEIRSQANIKNFKTVDALAKAYLHSQKMIGADKIAISKNPGEQEIREVQERLGLPKELEKYDVKAPQNTLLKQEYVDGLKKAAFEAGVLPAQAQKLVEWMNQNESQAAQSYDLQVRTQFEQNMNQIKSEWGEAYSEMTAKAKAALKEFGANDADVAYIKQNFGATPAVLRLLAKAGEGLSEDKIRGAGGGNSNAMTPSQALARIGEIKANVKGAYYDQSHGDHAATKSEMKKLYDIAYTTKKK